MRVLLTLIAFGMIAVPALLALFDARQSRARRIANALVIVLTPAIALGLIHGVPELDGRALQNPVAWTTLRLALSALALILPWCLYVWLSAKRR
jgi:cytochrome bd-type quinol oxidase subunit 2